jgi:mRNA interferase RelE/StbE
MYQVNFSEQSMKELNQLDITKQMEIAEIISSITKEALANPTEALQSFHRDKTVYYRVRANDFRIYFELKDEQLFAHYILHKNTLS